MRINMKILEENMGLTHVKVRIKSLRAENGAFEEEFLVDTGAADSLVPSSELRRIGVQSVGKTSYELGNGRVVEFPFGLAEIKFLEEIMAGRVIFGPNNVEPILGVTALESVAVTVDPATRTVRKLPAIPLKQKRHG